MSDANVNIRYMESWEEDYGFTLLLPSVIKEAIIEPSDRIMVYDDGDQKSLRQPFSHPFLSFQNRVSRTTRSFRATDLLVFTY